jgi:ATP/maltotriose-dependent transcriptional regulator MalT
MTKSKPIDPGFVLKIAPPSAKSSIVPRSWLTRQFDRIRDRPFVVVHAPGGYGKTTLLSRVELVVNLKTSREIVVTIPQAMLLRADKAIR